MKFCFSSALRAAAALVFLPGTLAGAQSSACPAAPATFNTTKPDIFSDQQEQWLGEALAEFVEQRLVFAPPQENAYLQTLGERILAQLPPTGMRFQFRIYESAELNAFSLGGGRVYVSRKLVSALNSEDEMAGVLAHEIGHIVTHQLAIEMTANFKSDLGVAQVGDRADVFQKVQAWAKSDTHRHRAMISDEGKQDIADQVAIYGMARAGYQPQAYAAAFDRITANKGKMGNGLADFFGMTTESQRRYRADVKMAQHVPEQCLGRRAGDNSAFLAWQKLLLERTARPEENKQAAAIVALKDPLRSDLLYIRFSPDGKYLLAQDYHDIFVLQHAPLKLLFTIEAEHPQLPHFTPDSRELVFLTHEDRVERWDMATQKRAAVKEMVLPEGCDWHMLSPDGHVLACERIYLDKNGWPDLALSLWNVESNAKFMENAHFKNAQDYGEAVALANSSDTGAEPGTFEFSPDSRWFIAGAQGSELIYDLTEQKKSSAAQGIASLRGRDFVFMGNDRIVALQRPLSQIYSFPDGKLLKSLPMGWQSIASVTQGNYAILRPIKDHATGLEDLDTGKLIAASNYSAMDVYGDEVATQTPQGGVQLNGLKPGAKEQHIDLPVSRIGSMLDANFTPDGKYLLLSTPERSAVWSVGSGTRLGMMRPFADASNLTDDTLYIDFTKIGDQPRMQRLADLKHGAMPEPKVKLPEKAVLLGDVYLLRNSPAGKQWWRDATLEFYDVTTGNLAWSRHFAKSAPQMFRADNDARIGLWWAMSIPSDHDEIESQPELKHAMEQSGDRRDGIVVQMVDAHTGQAQRTLAIKEHKPKKARDVRFLQAAGDYLLVSGEADNTVIYRMTDGARAGEVFGQAIGADAASGLLAFSNRRNEVVLVQADSARELARYALPSDVKLARFVTAEKKLLVLTAEEKVYTFAVGAAASGGPNPAVAAK